MIRCDAAHNPKVVGSNLTKNDTLPTLPTIATLSGMARPIEATPTLRGRDAKRLLDDLARVCSPEEQARRVQHARKQLAEMTRPKVARSNVKSSGQR